MALVIENPETIQKIERRAAATGKTPDEVVSDALSGHDTVVLSGALSEEQKAKAVQAIRELQDWYKTHRDPNDHRTADEIIGYDESGLPN